MDAVPLGLLERCWGPQRGHGRVLKCTVCPASQGAFRSSIARIRRAHGELALIDGFDLRARATQKRPAWVWSGRGSRLVDALVTGPSTWRKTNDVNNPMDVGRRLASAMVQSPPFSSMVQRIHVHACRAYHWQSAPSRGRGPVEHGPAPPSPSLAAALGAGIPVSWLHSACFFPAAVAPIVWNNCHTKPTPVRPDR